MRFLLDTNTIIALTRRGDENVRRRLALHHGAIGLSAIVAYELCFGAFRSDRPEHHLSTLDELPFWPVEFTADDARVAGQIRASLGRLGTPIGPYDTLIAGQALARDLTLVTNNVREFSRVEGLRIADWTQA